MTTKQTETIQQQTEALAAATDLVERLQVALAYARRDGWISYKVIQTMKAAGVIDDDQYSDASRLVESYNPKDYSGFDQILQRVKDGDLK